MGLLNLWSVFLSSDFSNFVPANVVSQSIRSPSESYRAHDAIVSAVSSSNGTVGHSLDLLRRLPAQKLYDIHAANHTQDGLALTLESGPHAVWKGDVLEKISRGEWDPWIEDVMVGTNEDEATYFLANSQVCCFTSLP